MGYIIFLLYDLYNIAIRGGMENYTIEEYSEISLRNFAESLKKSMNRIRSKVDVNEEFRHQLKQLESDNFDRIISEILELVGDIDLFNSILAKNINNIGDKIEKSLFEKAFINSVHIYALNLRLRSKKHFDIVKPIYFNNLVFNEIAGAKISKRKKLDLDVILNKLNEVETMFAKPQDVDFFALSHLRLANYFWRLCSIQNIFNNYMNNIFLLKFLIAHEAKLELYLQEHYLEEEQIEFIAQSKGGKARASNLEKTREPVYEEIKALWDTGKWKKATNCASDIHDAEGINLPYNTVYNFILKYKKSKSASTN